MSELAASSLPQEVADFIFDLHDACRRSQRIDEMKDLYSGSFVKLSNKFYSSSPWPPASAVASECESDPLFLAFYSELVLRHTFTSLRPTLSDKISSWSTYVALFEAVLTSDPKSSEEGTFMILPEWAFEVCHEFVYQFQGFCQYRHSVACKGETTSPQSILLRDNQDVWDLPTVMRLLTGVINLSKLQSDPTGQSSPSQMHRVLGYFGALSLSRLSCLLGDFTSSLTAVSFISLTDKNSLHAGLFAAQLSLSYHLGVSYMAVGRTRDAARTLSSMCNAIGRGFKTGYLLKGTKGQEQFGKLEMKMVALVTVLVGMGGGGVKVDDDVVKTIQERFGDKLSKIEEGEEGFEELYTFGCPKFVSPGVPKFTEDEKGTNKSADFYKKQVKMAVARAERARGLGKTRSTLKLYSNVGVDKVEKLVGGGGGGLKDILSLKLRGLQVEGGE
ncbi:hypothetical protein TrCOL_g2260 [Triparma columacea]|uniref:Eukaryotic translation initiation factor 3 subunit L n=1 Tax=Triparma columacea TaxID=722753 RepID=A0A9W7FVR3_9STRA|nr:hypothetical protein TrCOL_g2260 [Triparma columacea]